MLRNRSLLPLPLAITLCTPMVAQSYATSPPGVLNAEADVFSTRFGAFPNARFMLFDGEYRGVPLSIKELTFRDDYRGFDASNGMGRTWTNVTLTMSEGDRTNVSTIFSQNLLATPTQVFSGSVTWPTVAGHPGNYPADWDKRVPFAATWGYSGTNDIVLDHDFNGGTLANAATWGNTTVAEYMLDAPYTDTSRKVQPRHHGEGGEINKGCIDTGSVPAVGAMNFLHCNVFGPDYHETSYRGKLQLYAFTYYTAPGKPVAHVVNFVGSAQSFGAYPGIACNLLYLDVSRFLIVDVAIAAPTPGAWSGFIYPTQTPNGLFDYNALYIGVPLWSQALWNDSTTGALKLTRATNSAIPTMPRSIKRTTIYQPDPQKKASFGYGPYREPDYNPVMRYTR